MAYITKEYVKVLIVKVTVRAFSMISLRSETESELDKSTDHDVQYMEFDDFIQKACPIFECPVSIVVCREIIPDQPTVRSARQSRDSKCKRKSRSIMMTELALLKNITKSLEPLDDRTLILKAFYNNSNELLEIFVTKFHYQAIPRVLMQVIALKVPHTRNLTKFTIKHCRINMYTIYELNKILSLSNITDICLDHSPLKESNYDYLLSDRSRLQNLSLSRCNINDIVCERIAARLRHLEPAEPTLLALNLSSNHITDVGAKHLGEALRSNRHLRYLNVADNHIADDGARHIFDVLTEFPLTNEEIVDKGERYKNYWRKKSVLYYRNLNQLFNTEETQQTPEKKSPKKVTLGKSKQSPKKSKKDSTVCVSYDCLRTKAEAVAEVTLEPFEDPFSSSTTILKDGHPYSIGNFVLCYLNLSYNNLTFQSVQKLLAVNMYQKEYRNENICGLMNVLIEGNNVPEQCEEYEDISNELLTSKGSGDPYQSKNDFVQ